MKRLWAGLLFGGLFAVLVLSFSFSYSFAQNKTIKVDVAVETADDISGAKVTIGQGQTVMEALAVMTKEKGLELKYSGEGTTLFIENLMGVENGKDGKYWLVLVNDKPAGLEANDLKDGDKVRFTFGSI